MADSPSSPLSPAVASNPTVPKVAPAPAPVRPVVPVMVAQPPSPTTPSSPQTPAPPSTPPPSSTIAVPPPPPPAPGAPAKPTVVVVTKPAPSPTIAKPPSIPVPKPAGAPASSPMYRPAVAVPMPKLSNPIPQFPPHMVPQPFVPGMAHGMQGQMNGGPPGMPGFMDLDPNVFDPSNYPDPNYPPDEPTPPPAPIPEAAAPPTDAGLRQFTEHLAHLDVLLSTGIVENTHYEYQKARLVDRFVLADPNPTVEWRFANHLAYLDGLLAAGALNTMDHSFYKSQLVDSYVLCVGEWIPPQLPVITHRPLPLSAPCYGLVVMGAPMCQPLNPSLGALVLRPKVNRSYCYGPRDIFGKALPNVVLNAEDLRRLLCFKLTWDCIICSKVFSQEYPQLAQHYRARHPGTPQTQAILKKFWNKNLVCQFCSKTFTCMQGIMAHKRTVHLDQPQAQEELKAYDAQEEAEKVARWTKKTQLDMDKINAAYETLRELDGQYAALCRHAASTDQATMQLAAREMFIVVEAALKAMCVINVAARGGTAAPVVEGGAQEIRGGLLCQCMRYLGDNHLMPPKMGIRLDAARKLRNEVFHTLGVKITSQDLEEQRQLLEDVLTWGFAMLKTAAQVMGGDVGAGSGIGEFKAIQASAGVGTLEPPPAPNVPTPHEPKDMQMIVTNIKRSRSPDDEDRKRRRTSPARSPPPRARGRGRGGYNGIGAGRWGRGQDGAEIIKLLDGVEKERGDDRDDRSRDRRRSRSRGRDRRR